MTVPRVAILTNVIPSYREGFYDRLFARDDVQVDVFCQAQIPGMNVRTIHEKYPGHAQLLKAHSANNEAVVWQHTPWRRILFGYDVVFVDGNPRVLSHAVAATLLRLFGRNVVLWTMGHSYRANRVTERLRLAWTAGFKHIFLYTDAEVRAFRRLGFTRQHLSAMNNGLDQARIDRAIEAWDRAGLEAWQSANGLKDRMVLLSCTRLEPKNRFDLMVEALGPILQAVPNVVWCIVGSGRERERLATLADAAGVGDRVRFLGEMYEERELAPWFLSAHIFVHPAAIGLSLLHAFGYGLPVVTHDVAEHQGPEFGAFEDGRTGLSFREDDAENLAAVVVRLLRDDAGRVAMKQRAQDVARHDYNVDVMVRRFTALARQAAGAEVPRPTAGDTGEAGRND
jgi:glycosyltransferase involved in cell wall biosynthesis